MMNLRDTPIRTKLRVVILTTCTVALLVACAILFAIQFYVFKKDFREDLASVAAMLAARVAAAVTFENPTRAEAILGSLAVKPFITKARLVLKDGNTFAMYPPGTKPGSAPTVPPEVAVEFWENGAFSYAQPVEQEGVRIGTLYLTSNYSAQASRQFNLYLAIFCGVLTLCVLVGLLVSSRLARFVTAPLQKLADTVRTIAANNDYSVRANKSADDEVGAFTDSFNVMLGRIQNRDEALRYEIAERARAEGELQALHAQLLEASRQAGMAEVATGVLHNVGNVLNSVNVSATLVAEKLSIQRLNNLQRTAEMLHARNGGHGGIPDQRYEGPVDPRLPQRPVASLDFRTRRSAGGAGAVDAKYRAHQGDRLDAADLCPRGGADGAGATGGADGRRVAYDQRQPSAASNQGGSRLRGVLNRERRAAQGPANSRQPSPECKARIG
jgi:HAMP domain-containing protein